VTEPPITRLNASFTFVLEPEPIVMSLPDAPTCIAGGPPNTDTAAAVNCVVVLPEVTE